MTITSNEFWTEITSIAKSVLTDYDHAAIENIKELVIERNKRANAEDIADKQAEIDAAIDTLTIDDLDDVYDKVHEMVDGHEWVIYYSKAWDVAHLMSDDETACSEFEDMCSIERGKSLDDLICQFAYCAINSNVVAEMESALEEYKIELKKEV